MVEEEWGNIKNYFDSVFIINQNTDINNIKNITATYEYKNICIISSNLLFKKEKILFKDSVSINNISFFTFSDFITKEEMEAIDNSIESYKVIDKQKDILYQKNKIIFKKISKYVKSECVYYDVGLEISKEFWGDMGASPLFKPNKKEDVLAQFFSKVIIRLKSIFKKMNFYFLEYQSEILVFPTINRLNFEENIVLSKQSYLPILYYFLGIRNRIEIIKKIMYKKYINKKIRIVMRTHDYDSRYMTSNDLIAIDGYIPPNYASHYIKEFPVGKFIINEFSSKEWLKDIERKIVISGLMKMEFYSENIDIKKIENVVIFCNHAGDWSAKISRSDTDILLENILELAEKMKELNFIIRLHPTMTHERHEGKNSYKRIVEYVKELDLPNLSVTDKSLKENLLEGDVFLSEYSATIIDVWKNGKIGIICNFTKHESFMEVFRNEGFLYVEKKNELKEMLLDIQSNTLKYNKVQEKANKRINELNKEISE